MFGKDGIAEGDEDLEIERVFGRVARGLWRCLAFQQAID